MNEITIFSPATVANVSCGFDVLGFCLNTVGDEMTIRRTKEKGIRISKIEGFDLPLETDKNVAGVSALAMYEAIKPDCGFEIEIYKKIKPGSGIGMITLPRLNVPSSSGRARPRAGPSAVRSPRSGH